MFHMLQPGKNVLNKLPAVRRGPVQLIKGATGLVLGLEGVRYHKLNPAIRQTVCLFTEDRLVMTADGRRSQNHVSYDNCFAGCGRPTRVSGRSLSPDCLCVFTAIGDSRNAKPHHVSSFRK